MIGSVFIILAFAAAWIALFAYPCLARKSMVLLGRVGLAVAWALVCTYVVTRHSIEYSRVLAPAAAFVIGAICVELWFLWKSKPRTYLPWTSGLCVLIVLPLISYGGQTNNLDRWLRGTLSTNIYGLHGRAIFAVLGCIVVSAVLWRRLSKGSLRSVQVSAVAAAAFLFCISAIVWKMSSLSGGLGINLYILFCLCPFYGGPYLLLLVSCIATFAKSTNRLRKAADKLSPTPQRAG